MRIGYGLITCQRPPDDTRSDTEIYREAIERASIAESAGFASAWVSEHHFVDDGYMPSLLVVAAAIAQATNNITIGTAVLLAPLFNPLRLAEDAATVELISRGRFVLGIGAGWRGEEFDLLGINISERGALIRKTVKALRGAWSDDAFEFEGQMVNVTPKPAKPVPIWIGGFAPPAIARAGRIADGFLGSSTGTSGIEAFARAKEIALEARGRRDGFSFALHVPVYVSKGRDPWTEVKPYYNYLRWKYGDMAAKRASTEPASPPPLTAATEEQLRPTIICGSPQQVVEEIARFRDALGDDTHFICRSDFPGMPRAQALELIQTIGAEIIPVFH